MTLARRTFRGILWNFADQLGKRGINVLVTLLLAHILVPEDFGLVAIMSAMIAVANSLMESGFRQALIRMKRAGQEDYNTAFFSNLGLGLASFAIVYFAAPPIAGFYDDHRLVNLIRVGGITILINTFYVVQSAILSKELDFKGLLVASVPASLVAGVAAVILAWTGFGVWALVGQVILHSMLTSLIVWRISRWRPTLTFSRQSFSELYTFGSRLFAARIIDTIFRNLYVVVIAKVFATGLAGFYFLAEKIKELVVSQLVNSVIAVTYPALSTVQDDNLMLKDGFRKVMRATTFMHFPAMAFLAALAEPLFDVMLPDNWMPAVPYMQLLCIAGLLVPVHSINLNILQVKGRSDLFLRLEIIKKIMLVIILAISLQFGIFVVLAGNIITSVLAYIPNSYYSAKMIGYTRGEQFNDFMPALVLSGVVGVLAYAAVILIEWPALVELVVLGTLCVVLYIVLAYAFKMRAHGQVRELVAGLAGKQNFRII